MRLFVHTPPLALAFAGVLLVLTALEVALLAAYRQAVRCRALGVTAGQAWRALAWGRGSPALAELLTPSSAPALGRARRVGRAMVAAAVVLALLTGAAVLG